MQNAAVPASIDGTPAIADSVIELVGHTPLVRLNRIAPEGAAEVLGKLEARNPSGSSTWSQCPASFMG